MGYIGFNILFSLLLCMTENLYNKSFRVFLQNKISLNSSGSWVDFKREHFLVKIVKNVINNSDDNLWGE